MPARFPTNPAPAPRALRWVAAASALTVWLLGLLAASPDLHAVVHAEAGHSDHACAVTLFHAGVDDNAGGPDLVEHPVPYFLGRLTVATMPPAGAVQLRLPPGCGPPLS